MIIKQHNCEKCGSVLIYSEETKEFICEYCNNSYDYDESIDYYFDVNFCTKCNKYKDKEKMCSTCGNPLTIKKIGVRSFLRKRNSLIKNSEMIIYKTLNNNTDQNKMVRGKVYNGNLKINYKVNGHNKTRRFVFFNSFLPDIKDLTDNQIIFYLGEWVEFKDLNNKNVDSVNEQNIYKDEMFVDNSNRLLELCLKYIKQTEKGNITDLKIIDNINIKNKIYTRMPVIRLSSEAKNTIYETIKKEIKKKNCMISIITMIIYLFFLFYMNDFVKPLARGGDLFEYIGYINFIIVTIIIINLATKVAYYITKDYRYTLLYLSNDEKLFEKYFKKNISLTGDKHE